MSNDKPLPYEDWPSGFNYASGRRSYLIHRVVDPLGVTACGTTVDERFRHHPQTDVYECWTTGWRPCARCYPEFDLAEWNALRDREDVAINATPEGPDGAPYEKFWRETWDEVYRRRKANPRKDPWQVEDGVRMVEAL